MNDTSLTIDETVPRAWPSMVESKPLRFVATMILYFMQGVPLGLPFWFFRHGSRQTGRARLR